MSSRAKGLAPGRVVPAVICAAVLVSVVVLLFTDDSPDADFHAADASYSPDTDVRETRVSDTATRGTASKDERAEPPDSGERKLVDFIVAIVDAETQDAVESAEVSVLPAGDRAPSKERLVKDSRGRVRWTARTEEELQLSASADGYLPVETTLLIREGADGLPILAPRAGDAEGIQEPEKLPVEISIHSESQLAEIRIALRGRVELTGWIVDQFGDACAGLNVTIRSPAENVDTGEPGARSGRVGTAELALQSDSRGRFVADELPAGATVSVAVTGATVDGVRVFALEEEILLESPGPYELELEVELGVTLVCLARLPRNVPEGVAVGFVVLKDVEQPGVDDVLAEGRERIDTDNAQFTIGPVKPATTGIKLRCLIREGVPGENLAAEVGLPSLPVGRHEIEVPFSAFARKQPEPLSVEVVVVDENDEDLDFGDIDPDFRVWVRGNEEGKVQGLKRASQETYLFRGEVPAGELSYTVGVQIGRMMAVKDRVVLVERKAYRFSFPTPILEQTATLDVRIELPEGISRVYVSLDSVGQQLPCQGREIEEGTTFSFLPPGAYELTCGREFWRAPDRIIELQPAERREVRIQLEPARYVRCITPSEFSEGVACVSGTTAAGRSFETFRSVESSTARFVSIPFGDYTCRVVSGGQLLAPVRFTVDESTQEFQVRVSPDSGELRRVRFELESDGERLAWVEIRDSGGDLCWRHPTTYWSTGATFEVRLPPAPYDVAYCVVRDVPIVEQFRPGRLGRVSIELEDVDRTIHLR